MSVVINKVDIWSTLQPQYPDSGDDDEEHNDYDADGDYYHNHYYCGGSKDDVDIWSSLQPQYPDARTCPSKVINALTKRDFSNEMEGEGGWSTLILNFCLTK